MDTMPFEVIVALSVFGVMVLIAVIIAIVAAVSAVNGEKSVSSPDDE